MPPPLLSLPIRYEQDVVSARQRARQIAELLGFDRIEQTRLATAVSEIARNTFMYASGGRVDYTIEGATAPQLLVIRIEDRGPGIAALEDVLAGRYRSSTGLGVGLAGARRLVDRSEITTSGDGTSVVLAKLLPAVSPLIDGPALGRLAGVLASRPSEGPLGEVQQQNRELVRALDTLRTRQEELERVNRELEDTNRGVVALYAELDERADHLRRADELKTRFLSNMTHEFRTPLNSILALSRLLAERLEINETEKGELFYIRKSAQQLSDLVDDLLDIAKVEAGKIDVKPAYFEVRALFGALRAMLRPLLVGQSVALVFDDVGDLPVLYSDESKVSQVLRNFISNALKYTEAGEVRISCEQDPDRKVVKFAVRDSGIGIPEAELPRIFDEFVQIENPLQRRVKGTGLGLPLSRRLAELLGGRIDVASSLGVGSTFTLTLPLMYREAVTDVVTPQLVAGLVPVLVVEDGDEDLLIYHRLLARHHFQLVPVRTISAASTALGSIRPAAVILDIRLDGQDSWGLLAKLKHDSDTAGIPVVVVSSVDDHRKAFGLGADAVAVKPVDGDWLVRTLERLTGDRTGATRVLAVDDEEAFRFIIREILPLAEYELFEAQSGEEALALLEHGRPDVVLLDINLPGIDGFAVAGDPRLAGIPIIIVSSRDVTAQERRRMPGVRRVIPKSTLSRDVLRAAIRDVVMTSRESSQDAPA